MHLSMGIDPEIKFVERTLGFTTPYRAYNAGGVYYLFQESPFTDSTWVNDSLGNQVFSVASLNDTVYGFQTYWKLAGIKYHEIMT